MQIFLTHDYEIFFGQPTGSAENCILHPTQLFQDLCKRTGVKMTFFIDVGYLKKLSEFKDAHPKIKEDYQNIYSNIKELVAEGHDCQLHIHPHWEDSYWTEDGWKMVTDRYKLDDFSDQEIQRIIEEYHKILQDLTGKPVTSFRAGGWCMQPFNRIEKALQDVGVNLDSTVFPGGKFTAGNYYYDYTNSPKKGKWKFQSDPIAEQKEGHFWEYPISSYKYGPLFFWRLFALGRLKPDQHKPMGDGYPMASPGLRKRMLTQGMNLSAAMDGYFVTKLNQVLKANQRKGYDQMVVLGHPKATTKFALRKLEKFIEQHKNNHEFLTFADLDL